MAVEIRVPTLGESLVEATVGQWRKREGRLLGVSLPPLLAALRASGEKITRAMGIGAPQRVPA